jgi:hypothetical protein
VVVAASVVVVVGITSSEVVVVTEELISHGKGCVEHEVVVVVASRLVAEPVVLVVSGLVTEAVVTDSTIVEVERVGSDSTEVDSFVVVATVTARVELDEGRHGPASTREPKTAVKISEWTKWLAISAMSISNS